MNIKIGADPELFLFKGDTPVSGHGMIEGDKKNPYPVENGAVQVDGMALEFNINPAEDEETFVTNLSSVLEQLRRMVPEYDLKPVPVANFSREYLDTQPEEAKELGCDPDMNAWTEKENPVPDADADFRTGSGHIHLGWTDDAVLTDPAHRAQAYELVKQLDFYLGLPSLFFDEDTKRRELYGKAGACRIKPYGVEYRVLSNKWLESKELMSWVFSSAKEAINQLMNGNSLTEKFGDIQDIINTSDSKKAYKVLRESGIAIPA